MISVVLQGPTDYCNFMPNLLLENFNEKYEFIFSTWSDQPKENLKIIENKGFSLVIDNVPENKGFHNINCQTLSSLNGIKNCSGEFILKIRSDMFISNIDLFIKNLSREKMSFLAFHNHDGGYVCDYINFGNKEDMQLWYSYKQISNEKIPPEKQLLYNFWDLKKYDYNLLFYPEIKKIFYFFLEDLKKENIDIFWFKNKLNLKDYFNDKLFLY